LGAELDPIPWTATILEAGSLPEPKGRLGGESSASGEEVSLHKKIARFLNLEAIDPACNAETIERLQAMRV
jgi:hypothetical protein